MGLQALLSFSEFSVSSDSFGGFNNQRSATSEVTKPSKDLSSGGEGPCIFSHL
jgi:hypothetical protein